MKNLQIDGSTGLVLEGGGMRGVFTCGVLDYFMDHDIRFPYAIVQRIVVCITATGTCQVQQYRLVGEVQLYRSEIFAQKA